MTRPTAPTDWADAAGANRATVPTAIRDLGVPPGDVFRSTYYNEALHDVGLWLGYLATASPADLTWKIGRIIMGNDPLSGLALTITDSGGATGGMEIDVTKPGASFNVAMSSGTGAWIVGGDGIRLNGVVSTQVLTIAAYGGVEWFDGFVVTPQSNALAAVGSSTHTRWHFAASETMAIDISPASGGWTFQRATSGTALGYASGAGAAASPFVGSEAVRLNDSQNTGDCWRRPLVEVEPSASRAGTVWKASGMGLQAIVAATGPVRIRVGQRNRATGSESAFGSFVVQSNTTPTGSHLFTYAPGSPLALDLETYSYFLEMDVTDLNASSQVIERAYLTLTKSAAD